MKLKAPSIGTLLSLFFFSLFISSSLQTILVIGGLYLAEILVFLSFLFGRKSVFLAGFLESRFFSFNLNSLYAILLWSLISLSFAPSDSFRLILSETRSLVFLCTGFCLTRYALLKGYTRQLYSWLFFTSLSYPFLYFILLVPFSGSGSGVYKVFPQIPLFILSVGILLLLRRFRCATLLLASWTPVLLFSFFRSSLVLGVYFFVLLSVYVVVSATSNFVPVQRIVAGSLAIVFAFICFSGFLPRFDSSYLSFFYQDSVLFQTQILHKLDNAGSVDSDQARDRNFRQAFSFDDIFPSLLPYGTSFDLNLNDGMNNLDSGYLYISRRFGVLLSFALLFSLFRVYLRNPIVFLCIGAPFLFFLYYTGSFSNIGALAGPVGAILALSLCPCSFSDSFGAQSKPSG